MKKLLILSAMMLLAGTSCQPKVDIKKEKAAIQAVIENETNAYKVRDWDKQSNCFLQDESAIALLANKYSYIYAVGWDSISMGYHQDYKNRPNPITNIYQFANFKIKVYKESAWAVYDENMMNTEGVLIRKNISVRFLEKVDGEWKITFLGFVNATSYEEENEENE